jgi:hypothetical protein
MRIDPDLETWAELRAELRALRYTRKGAAFYALTLAALAALTH